MGHFGGTFGPFFAILSLFSSPTQWIGHLLASINNFLFCFIICTFIQCEIYILLMFCTQKNLIHFFKNMFFSCHTEYDPSPTKIEKSDFFQILSKKYFFLKFLGQTIVLKLEPYALTSHTKKSIPFWWIFMAFLILGLKGGQNVKKLREHANSFHGHFCNDFSIFCIFPIEEMYQK